MKKVLLIVAMLLAVSPVMAAVTVTAVNEGTFLTTGLPGDANRSATIRIGYTYTTDANVRAFALDINIDGGCNFWNVRDFNVGENKGTNNGYGIFPGRFRQYINPSTPDACYAASPYNPTPYYNDPGSANTGIGFGEIIAELGYLGAGEVNRPATSGTLFRVDVNAYQFSGTAHVTIVPDAMRGGIVNKDTGATIAWAGSETDVCFPCIPVTIPTIVGLDLTDANTALANAGFSVGNIGYEMNNTYAAGLVCRQDTGSECTTIPVNYWVSTGMSCVVPTNEVGQLVATATGAWTTQGFTGGFTGTPVVNCAQLGKVITNDQNCVSLTTPIKYTYGVAPAEPNVVGMTRAAAVTALTNLGFVIGTDVNGWGGAGVSTVGNVFAQNPVAGTTGCGTTVNLSVVSYPIKPMTATGSLYVNWVNRSKPACWAYPRQCHGNADGKIQSSLYWCGSNELAVLKTAFNKSASTIPPGGICASFDHKIQSSLYWVGSNELTILKAYFNKAASLVPVCGNVVNPSTDPNYWYWCLPVSTPATTCPSGQYCAPAGTCPNTP